MPSRLLFGDDGLVMRDCAEPVSCWNVYQTRDERKHIQRCLARQLGLLRYPYQQPHRPTTAPEQAKVHSFPLANHLKQLRHVVRHCK